MGSAILLRARLELRTPLPPGELLRDLGEKIAAPPAQGVPFTGRVSADGFLITRLNEYRSSFMPQVDARVEAAPQGSRVRLSLRPHRSVFVFLGIWYLFLAAFAAIVVAGHALHPERSLLFLLVPAALAGFSWYLAAGVFAADVRWTLWALGQHVPGLVLQDCDAPGA